MANYPKKMTDPTEAALSAIQEALNIHDEDERTDGPAEEFPAPPPSADHIMRETEPFAPAFRRRFRPRTHRDSR